MDIENTSVCRHDVIGFCISCQEEFKSDYFKHYLESYTEKETNTTYFFPAEFLRET